MSGILELLKEAKVEWKRLGEVKEIQLLSPKGKLKRKEYSKEGSYPIIDQGQDFIAGYTDHYEYAFDHDKYIIFGDHTEIVKYVDFRFVQGADGIKVLKTNENYIDSRYLYHAICCLYKKTGKYRRHYSFLLETIIPIPSLEVQKEIARILDAFAELTTELTQALSKELTLRKKQYEYYRNVILNNAQGRECKLSDISTFVRGPFGSSLRKTYFKPNGYAVYEQRHAIYANLEIRYFIDEKKFNELKRFEVMAGDIIVCCSGTIGNAFVIPDGAPKGIINQALLILRPKADVLADYIKYIFENRIREELIKGSRGGAIKNVRPINEIKEIKILLPSLEEQKNIVKILDKMQKLNNETQGLIPAEIALRQKQYEYYRERLLGFDRTSGNTQIN